MKHLAFFLVATAPFALAEKYTIDPAHAAAEFAAKHMMVSTVRGNLGKVTGTVDYDPANVAATRIEATIDVKGLSTRNDDRDKHLRSADFFDADKFPTITFVSKSVAAAGNGRLKVTGDLTIKGVTKQVVLDVEGPSPPLKDQRGSRVGATATTKVNRMDYGVNWNRVLSNGLAVSEEISVTLDIEMVSAPAPKQGN
jgi:polyisoprenoid-binding protein YceI